jgi:transposase
MSYTVAGIDIHKKVLMVVLAMAGDEVRDPAGEAIEFECRRFGTGAAERNHVVSWLREHEVTEVVMESTAQYWKPVWLDLEPHFAKLHLAQAHSNRAPKGRKNDFSGCPTTDPPPAGRRADFELCAGRRTTRLADRYAR